MKNNNKKKKTLTQRLFSSNIALLILAFILSFVSWFVVSSVSDNNIRETVIENVPVTITISDSNYTYFLSKNTPSTQDEESTDNEIRPFASVKVEGNPFALGSLKPQNIKLTGTIDQSESSLLTPQEYKVSLTSELVDTVNVNIKSTDPSTFTVFVDKKSSKTFDIQNEVTVQNVNDDQYVNTTLSPETVDITGPETIVSQIDSVKVIGKMNQDTTVMKSLLLFDENDNEIDDTYLKTEFDKVEVTSTGLNKKKVTLKASLTGAPKDIDVVPTVSPENVLIAGPDDKLNDLTTIDIGTIDYSELTNTSNTIVKNIVLPEKYSDCKIISDKDNEQPPSTAKVNVDLHAYEGNKDLSVNIEYKKDGYYIEFIPSYINVTVCGDEEEVDSIKASDITVTPDFSNKLDDLEVGKTVSLQNIPLKLSISDDYKKSWIYGKYTVEVKVTKIK